MNQPSHRERAEDYLDRAESALHTSPDHANVVATLATCHAVLAHLDALALPEPGAGEAILAAARKLSTELDIDQDHDHGGVTGDRNDQAQGVIPGAHVGRVAPETGSPVYLDGRNGDGDLTADLAEVVASALCVDPRLSDHPIQTIADITAHAVLTAGWRPGAEQLTREDRRDLAAVMGYELGEDEARRRLIAGGWRPPLPDGGQDLAEHVASAIADALATHPWEGGHHSGHPLSVFAEVATAAVMPFLDEPKPDLDIVGRRHVAGQLEVASDSGPWYVRILDEAVHHTSEEAPALIDWTRDGRMIGVELLGSGRERTPQPAPQVFFPGDTVPAGVPLLAYVATPEGRMPVLHEPDNVDRELSQWHGVCIEIVMPSLAEWQAVADRARAEREQSTTDTEASPTRRTHYCAASSRIGFPCTHPGSHDGPHRAVFPGGSFTFHDADAQRTPGGFPYRQMPHELCGANADRQSVGDPGHCEDCCSVGHVVAHPDLGCGDVGCYRTHGDEETDHG